MRAFVNSNVIESQIFNSGVLAGWSQQSFNTMVKVKEYLEVKGARNRILKIEYSDFFDAVNRENSEINIKPNRLEIKISIDLKQLIKNITGYQRLIKYDRLKIGRECKEINLNLKRPLFENGWENIKGMHEKFYSRISPSEISNLVLFYHEGVGHLIDSSRDYFKNYLQNLGGKQLYGEFKFVFSEVIRLLNNLDDFTLLKYDEFSESVDPRKEFEKCDEIFSKANFGYLDFLLGLKRIGEPQGKDLEKINSLYGEILQRMNFLNLSKPVKLPLKKVEVLIDSYPKLLV